ncbi:ATP-binding cassette domain-containing protein [Candidatus Poribacteria bacterium]|nr:ATP-binding cassette domain-containing protein [Candidatus Poribacteria bacterium]
MSASIPEEPLPIGPKGELPKVVEEEFNKITKDKEEIHMAVSSDMSLEGDFKENWFLATDKRIMVFNGDHSVKAEVVKELLLVDIDDVKLKNYIGNGVLEITTKDKAVEFLRFSKTAFHQNEIGEIPKVIDKIREKNGHKSESQKSTGEQGPSSKKDHRCEKCGAIIPHWTGTCPNCLDKGALLGRLFSYLKPYWQIAIIAFLLTLVTTALGLVPTYLTKYLTDRVFAPVVETTTDRRLFLLNVFVLAIIGIHITNTLLGAGRTYMMQWLGNKVIYDLRTSAYQYLQRLSLSFYNKKETGRLMSRISNDTGRLQEFIVHGIQDFAMNILKLVGMCTVLFITNWRLATLSLVPIPTMIVGSIIFGKKMHMVYHKVWRRMAGISAVLADTIPGVRVVKAFAAEDREITRFNIQNEEFFTHSMRAAKISTIYFPLMGLATFAGGIIIRWFGGRDIIGGEMTLGELMLFVGYMWQFYGPIHGLTRLNHSLQRAASSAERVFEILDAQPDVDDKEDAVELPAIKGDIKFEDVVFSYDDEKNAIDGISFEVKAGEMIGLSGPSGAGKSTLINLLGRFYDVSEGAIYVDGHNIKEVTMKSLRSQIGVVLQEPFLFHGSIAENIAYGKPDATRASVVAAAKTANAHDFIMNFPDGYDTMVGERGVGLSGGEKQRISIARAILKDPRILILDEATSSVDTETESQIQAAIERLVEGRTTFAIAHRLSTLRKADKLIILEKGVISEMGTHDELIKNNGLYKRLVDMQSELSSIKVV